MADYKIEIEFPDYPVDSLPGDIPEWLECVPWHNDACPIWYMRGYEDPEAGIHLAIDYPDAERREIDGPRYRIWMSDALQNYLAPPLNTDDWEAAKAELERLSAKWAEAY